jgi:hypothetical protein
VIKVPGKSSAIGCRVIYPVSGTFSCDFIRKRFSTKQFQREPHIEGMHGGRNRHISAIHPIVLPLFFSAQTISRCGDFTKDSASPEGSIECADPISSANEIEDQFSVASFFLQSPSARLGAMLQCSRLPGGR